MKDQIGQYIWLESNAERLPKVGNEMFKHNIATFFSSQNPYDLLSYLLTLIVFTKSTSDSANSAEQATLLEK